MSQHENKDKFDGIRVTFHEYNEEKEQKINELVRCLSLLDRIDNVLNYNSVPIYSVDFGHTIYPRMSYPRMDIGFSQGNLFRRILQESFQSQNQLRRTNRKINITEKKYDPSSHSGNCPICKEEYKENETVSDLPCNHLFHTECIREWGRYKAVCPLCKSSIPIKDCENKNN